MTEPPLYPNPPVATSAQSPAGPFYSFAPSHQSPYEPVNNNEDEDDSTIKCICGFKHDDGSSVFCESCKTWQHTQCYYWIPDLGRAKSKDELEKITHLCLDCEPRTLNTDAARIRQKARLDGGDQDERRAKKSATKSHKKKTKMTDTNGIVANGWSPDLDSVSDRNVRSPRDHVSAAKNKKTSHKSSHSVGISALLPTAASGSHKRSVSAVQSPVKTSHRIPPGQFFKEHFTEAFMHLYDDDPGDEDLHGNTYSNISITADLANWAKDTDALREATRKFSHHEVFHRLEKPLEKELGKSPRKESREDRRVCINGRHPRWKFLTSEGTTDKDTIVGELKGTIGYMRDYIQDPDNKWDELRHPAPFVFFHPKLPIYIDTRDSGSICRYLRRSCRPNLHMITFLENGSDYRFCYTAKEKIESEAEFTIGWTLDEHMRKFVSSKSDITQDLSPGGEEYVTDWVSKVSPEFGGCACNSPDTCWFVRYDIEYKHPSHRRTPQARRKPQVDPHDSSDMDDRTSSSQSDSGSRGITPTAQGLDISERDKRKIAALEKSWENDKHQPAPKRKKRNSGSSAHPSVTAPSGSLPHHARDESTTAAQQQTLSTHHPFSISLPNTPGLQSRPQYVDVGTSGRKSGSPTAKGPNGLGRPKVSHSVPPKTSWSHPNTPTVPSPLRATYVSTGMQTDPDSEGDWLQPVQPSPTVKKPFMSMTKRLLLQSQKDRKRLAERRISSDVTGHSRSPIRQASPPLGVFPTNLEPTDVVMTDISNAVGSTGAEAAVKTMHETTESEGHKSIFLLSKDHQPSINGTTHLSAVQDAPIISPVNSTISPKFPTEPSIAPLQAALAIPPQPLTTSIQPSPMKKTINLQEYMKRKASSSAESRAAPGAGLGSPEQTHRSLKSPNGTMTYATSALEPLLENNSAIVDTPKKEIDDPMDTSIATAHAPATTLTTTAGANLEMGKDAEAMNHEPGQTAS